MDTIRIQIKIIFIVVLVWTQCLFNQQKIFSRSLTMYDTQKQIYIDTIDQKIVWTPYGEKTIMLQIGNGFLWSIGGAAVGSITGYLIGSVVYPNSKGSYGGFGDAVEMGIMIAGITTVMSSSYGIYTAGRDDGGNGTYLGTVMGQITAVPISILTILLLGDKPGFVGVGIVVTLVQFVGPIIGYHYSASPIYKPDVKSINSNFDLIPKVNQYKIFQVTIEI